MCTNPELLPGGRAEQEHVATRSRVQQRGATGSVFLRDVLVRFSKTADLAGNGFKVELVTQEKMKERKKKIHLQIINIAALQVDKARPVTTVNRCKSETTAECQGNSPVFHHSVSVLTEALARA